MLGKLFKYDFKNYGRIIMPAYLILMVLTLLAMAGKLLCRQFPQNSLIYFLSQAAAVFFLLGVVVLLICTVLIALLQFRNNLLRDEGYLMHTLPVSANSLVLSKLLTALLWIAVTVVLCCLFIGIASCELSLPVAFIKQLFTGDTDRDTILICLFITLGLAVVQLLCQIYASLSLGYRISCLQKDVAAVAVYIGFYLAGQIVSAAVLLLVYMAKYHSLNNLLEQANTDTPFDILSMIMVIAIAMQVVWSIFFYVLSVRSLGRRLNLE